MLSRMLYKYHNDCSAELEQTPMHCSGVERCARHSLRRRLLPGDHATPFFYAYSCQYLLELYVGASVNRRLGHVFWHTFRHLRLGLSLLCSYKCFLHFTRLAEIWRLQQKQMATAAKDVWNIWTNRTAKQHSPPCTAHWQELRHTDLYLAGGT